MSVGALPMIETGSRSLSRLAKMITKVLLTGGRSDIICPTTGKLIPFEREITIDGKVKGCGYVAFGYYYVLQSKNRWMVVFYSAKNGDVVGFTRSTDGNGRRRIGSNDAETGNVS